MRLTIVPLGPCGQSSVRSDQGEFWEISTIAARIAGDQIIPGDGCVGANKEIGERGSLAPPSPAVGEKSLAREESGLIGDRLTVEDGFRQGRVQILDPRIADRNLGKDNRVDDETKPIGRIGKSLC